MVDIKINETFIFPTTFYTIDVGSMLDMDVDAKVYKEYCIEARTEDPTGREYSNTDGWQSKEQIANINFKSLFGATCSAAGGIAIQHGMARADNPPFIASAWINFNHNKRAINRPHIHPDTWMSAVYYVNVPPQSGTITFLDSRIEYHMVNSNPIKQTDFNSSDYTLNPKQGELIIFPAWLQHYVTTNDHDDHRISIAMNVQLQV
tara:strand:+ start:13037 stop:13651 length:615 start_codon:yes stop_codon:yes gene_type:complete